MRTTCTARRDRTAPAALRSSGAGVRACGAWHIHLAAAGRRLPLAFLGAGVGQYVRARLTRRRLTLFGCIALSVAAACLVYAGLFRLASLLFPIEAQHQAGYICAMLFIIPGFPFITSGIDMAKQDMRSGLERLAYAIMIVVVATLTAWLMALLLRLQPMDFLPLALPVWTRILLRLAASFCGVFGFSLMFNSPVKLASVAAVIGALSNTLRLELVSLAGFPPAAAAFLGALAAGLLASVYKQRSGYPRITITVPSIVIMVPGLYFYRAVYDLGTMNLGDSASWLVASLLIVISLPLGLICARILTDSSFRRCT
ncbi:MAG: threonine/serine exporter family protein [Oscillospiraceae bacterium]